MHLRTGNLIGWLKHTIDGKLATGNSVGEAADGCTVRCTFLEVVLKCIEVNQSLLRASGSVDIGQATIESRDCAPPCHREQGIGYAL